MRSETAMVVKTMPPSPTIMAISPLVHRSSGTDSSSVL